MAARATVRMYRQGLGDCFVVTFPTEAGGSFRVMIDCGVILGQPNAQNAMQAVVKDIADTYGTIDLLVATHEHWDHISGFVQAWEGGKLPGITFKHVWLAWTEDPANPQAQKLAGNKSAALAALAEAQAHMALAGNGDVAEGLAPFLEQLGLAADSSTAQAMANIKTVVQKENLRFRKPTDPPEKLDGTNVTVFVLGPPLDDTLLHTLSKGPTSPVMYGLDASSVASANAVAPFGGEQTLPIEAARRIAFFQRRYFGTDVQTSSDDAPAWRRIDDAWLGSATDLALQLDSYTNNTSLVLCFQLPDGSTMLFPGDAQIGSWLSWPTLSWKAGDATITGADLLAKCTFYKVGHHGSHNATAKSGGLETMKVLATAMIPVDEQEAKKKNWDRMPLPAIVSSLEAQTQQHVIRADQPPAGTPALYVEVTI